MSVAMNPAPNPLSMRDKAIALAKRGFRVFRIPSNSKGGKAGFIDVDWTKTATNDPFEIFDTWPEDGYNIAILTSGMVVLDVDVSSVGGHKLDGRLLLSELEPLPATFRVRTPSGGMHIYLDADGLDYGQRDLGPGINIRAKNGYVVAPGSIIEGVEYTIVEDAPLAVVPQSIVARLTAAPERLAPAIPDGLELDTPAALEQVRAYLLRASPAIEGAGGDAQTYSVACRCLNLGASPETTLELMDELYNPRCEPPWEYDGLAEKVRNAAAYIGGGIGRDAPGIHMGVIDHPPVAASDLLLWPSDISREAIASRKSNALLQDLIYPGDLAIIYGDSGAGKTFVALDMCFAIAHGKEWHGRRVNKSAILYVSLEGNDGFDMRTCAAVQYHGDAGKHFARLKMHISLVREGRGEEGVRVIAAAVAKLAEAAGIPVGLVVVDTLARAMAGDDENATDGMMAFVENRAGSIQRTTGAAVLMVHHRSKAGDMRGAGALRGAADCVLRAEKTDTGERTVHAEKVKDGPEGLLFSYKLDPVDIIDSRGEVLTTTYGAPIVSCVVKEVNASDAFALRKSQLLQLIAQREADGTPIPVSERNGKGPASTLALGSTQAKNEYEKALALLVQQGAVRITQGERKWDVYRMPSVNP